MTDQQKGIFLLISAVFVLVMSVSGIADAIKHHRAGPNAISACEQTANGTLAYYVTGDPIYGSMTTYPHPGDGGLNVTGSVNYTLNGTTQTATITCADVLNGITMDEATILGPNDTYLFGTAPS